MIPKTLDTTKQSAFTIDLYNVNFNSLKLTLALFEWDYKYNSPSKVDTIDQNRTKYFQKDFDLKWSGSSNLLLQLINYLNLSHFFQNNLLRL